MERTNQKKIRVLYIPRDYWRNKKSDLKKVISALIKRKIFFYGVEGYFDSALHSAFNVVEMSAGKAIKKFEWINKNFDFVVVNYACQLKHWKQNSYDRLIEVAKHFTIPKGIFIAFDEAGMMPAEHVFDEYDIFFKRESLRNLSYYHLSPKNEKKIVPTMLPCPFSLVPRNILMVPLVKMMLPKINKNVSKKEYDVFFSGTVAQFNNFRISIWRRVKDEGFKTIGGLQYRNRGEKPEDDLLEPEYSLRKYVDIIKKTKICLALNGNGEFTFRHLELWQLGAFMLCPKVINEINLPINIEDGKHFVSFSNIDDLIVKIRYYLSHEEEREKIARQGREMFEREYGSVKHGEYLRKVLVEKLKI